MWPVDATKSGRDLGSHLRIKVGDFFRMGEASPVPDKALCDAYYESIRRLATNYHKKKFDRVRATGAMGIPAEKCSFAVSSQVLTEVNKQAPSSIARLRDKIMRREQKPTTPAS